MTLDEMIEEFENIVKLLRASLQSGDDDRVKKIKEDLDEAEESLQSLRALVEGDY